MRLKLSGVKTMSQGTNECKPDELWMNITKERPYQLIDVREPFEYKNMRIKGSESIPLSLIHEKSKMIEKHIPAYLICQSGNRAHKAAEQLSQLGVEKTNVLKGGLQAWIAAGYPVEHELTNAWSLERQVRFTAGLLILIGIVLAYTVSANWICLSAFVALGMIVSAITNTCGMAIMLAKMPWNKVTEKSSEARCATTNCH